MARTIHHKKPTTRRSSRKAHPKTTVEAALRIDHLGICVADLTESVRFLSRAFGFKLEQEFTMQLNDGSEVRCAVIGCGSIDMVLAQPITPGMLATWIEHHGPGIHHLGFATNNIKEATTRARDFGIEFQTVEPAQSEGLSQIMSQGDELLGLSYELIERSARAPRFSKRNAGHLMMSPQH